jgi:hypothetical protein
MTLLTLPSFLENANSKENEGTEPVDEYAQCVEKIKCPNDGKDFSKLTEEEKHETYHCRVKRHLTCSVPKEDN